MSFACPFCRQKPATIDALMRHRREAHGYKYERAKQPPRVRPLPELKLAKADAPRARVLSINAVRVTTPKTLDDLENEA